GRRDAAGDAAPGRERPQRRAEDLRGVPHAGLRRAAADARGARFANRARGRTRTMSHFEGGCLCRDIRYRIDDSRLISATCECPSCRRASAAAIVPWIHLPESDLTFTSGKPVEFRSSADVARTFCGRCGTPITYRKDSYDGMIDVTTCSLDDP